MATFTVWKFDSSEGASAAVATLEQLQKEELITVIDAATVTWEAGKKRPKTRQLDNLTASGALGGAFWGMLFGLIFFVPLLGAAIGAATGAVGGALTDVGIDDEFIESVKSQVTPGTSALFLMTADGVIDKVRDAFEGVHPELVHTNLSHDQEAALRAAFGEE